VLPERVAEMVTACLDRQSVSYRRDDVIGLLRNQAQRTRVIGILAGIVIMTERL